MGLAIILWCIAVTVVVVAMVLLLRNIIEDSLYAALFVLGGILAVSGVFSYYSPFTTPAGVIYSIGVNGSPLCFTGYQEDGNDLLIPTHYYVTKDFINTWELCDTPIRVEVPDGQKLIIQDLRPQPEPYIVGGCK
jgi:hypothetical protein